MIKLYYDVNFESLAYVYEGALFRYDGQNFAPSMYGTLENAVQVGLVKFEYLGSL